MNLTTLYYYSFYLLYRSLHGVVVNVLNCDIVVSHSELQSCYYVHFQINTFGKGISPISSSYI